MNTNQEKNVNNRSFLEKGKNKFIKLFKKKENNNNNSVNITNKNLNNEINKQNNNNVLRNANISNNNLSNNFLNNNKPNNSLNNNKPNNSLNNKKPNNSLNNKNPNNSVNFNTPNSSLNFNKTITNKSSVKNIYNNMDTEQKRKMIRIIFDKHSFDNIKEHLTKKKQHKLVKQARKATLHTLTKSEKKKVCVNYKINKNTKKLTRKMKQNENNAKNLIFNKAMSKKK